MRYMLAALSLLAASVVQAANGPQKGTLLMNEGYKMLELVAKHYPNDSLLNPIVCASTTRKRVEIIYSEDFRAGRFVYAIQEDRSTVMKVRRADVSMRRVSAGGNSNGVNYFGLVLNNHNYVCVTSLMQLESVFPQ